MQRYSDTAARGLRIAGVGDKGRGIRIKDAGTPGKAGGGCRPGSGLMPEQRRKTRCWKYEPKGSSLGSASIHEREIESQIEIAQQFSQFSHTPGPWPRSRRARRRNEVHSMRCARSCIHPGRSGGMRWLMFDGTHGTAPRGTTRRGTARHDTRHDTIARCRNPAGL